MVSLKGLKIRAQVRRATAGGIDSLAPVKFTNSGSELEFLNKEARNRIGIGLSYPPARLHRLAEFIPWNRFQSSINI
jgi:hypothetical protein